METDDPQNHPDPMNRRITGMILAFVGVSLAASALPLVPDVRDVLPLGVLARDRGMTAYGLALAGFMAMILPLFARARDRAGLAGWWWMGGFLLAFSGAPLFLLAYIAGVHRDGVLEVLMQAGILHGLALIALRLVGSERRALVAILGFALVVVLPLLDGLGGALTGGDERFAFSPASRILAVTGSFATPRLVLPLVVLVATYAVLLAMACRGRGRRAGVVAAVLAVVAGLVAGAPAPETSGATAPAAATPELLLPAGGLRVAGRATPVRVDLRGEQGVVVEIGERERWVIEPADLPARRTWIFPRLLGANEAIVVRSARGAVLARAEPHLLPADERLVLAIGEEGGALGAALGAAARAGVHVSFLAAADLDGELLVLDPFSAVVLEARTQGELDRASRAALDGYVARGGRLLVLGDADADRGFGLGRVLERRELAGDALDALPDREQPTGARNLYSAFSLPDWRDVDLDRVLIFLVVYHLVFVAVFLLPLALDSRKSMSVYLVSVGFVLALVTVGAYLALKAIFLTETQVLLQRLDVLVHAPVEGGEDRLERREFVCFSSFNGQPARIVLERDHAPQLWAESADQSVGTVTVRDDVLVLEALPLDRHRRKQVLELTELGPAPFSFARTEEGGRLVPRGEEPGLFGADGPRALAAFARIGGRLHAARLEGERLIIAPRPALLGFGEVLPDTHVRSLPFLRWALGRIGPPAGDLAIVLTEGVPPLHEGRGYLHESRVLQVLALPLGPPR